MQLAVEVPRDKLGTVASNEMWGNIYDRLSAVIEENRTTLVFVNTRRLAERVAHHLAKRLGESGVAAHHGSLSREIGLVSISEMACCLKALKPSWTITSKTCRQCSKQCRSTKVQLT